MAATILSIVRVTIGGSRLYSEGVLESFVHGNNNWKKKIKMCRGADINE